MISKIHWSLLSAQLTKKVNQEKYGWGSKHISYISKTNTDVVDKSEKSQTSKEKVPTSPKTTDTLNAINKSRYTPRTNLSNKSTRIEKPTEIDIHKDNEKISLLYGKLYYLASVTLYILCIPYKNKIKKTPDTSVIRKEPIGELVNPRKKAI